MKAFSVAVLLIIQGLVLPSQNGVVTGQLHSRAGVPAAGVRIVAQALAGPGETSADGAAYASLAETDAQGRYRLEGLPAGRYHIAAGFLSSLTFYPGVATLTEARTVTVVAGATIENIDFALTGSAGVRVSGYLKGVPDDPTLGTVMRVTLQPQGPVARGGARTLDTSVQPGGRFEFLRVPPGIYILRVPLTSAITPTAQIRVQDVDISDVEIKMPLAVTGRVRLDDGAPLPISMASVAAGIANPQGLVRIQARKNSPSTTVVSTVGANGSFVLFLPPGEYRVEVPQLPLGYDVKSISYGKFNLLESLLTVTESKVEVELTLAPTAMQGGKVSGTVTGSTANAAISPSWVELRWSGPQLRIAEKAVQADGTFEFQNVPPGSYTIRALPSGQPQSIAVSGDGRSDIELKLLDSRGITGQLTVLLGNLASRVSSSVPVPAGSLKLSGRVVTVQGTPTPRTVRLRAFTVQQPPKGGFDAAVSSDGTFQFEGLANGEFTVSVVDSAVLAARNFTNEANDIIGMELKVPVPARGRVVMLDGSSVPPSTMWIRNAYPGGETGGARTPPIRQQDFDIQADGSFSIGVVRGEQRVLVENLPAGFSVRSITYGSVNLLVNPLNVTTPLTSEIVVTLQRTSQSQRE